MQQSGHHFQPHAQKRQETNFHQNISECQFKSVSSHKCLTNSKLNLSAHTNFSLSSKGRESHSHLASHKCLTKLHAAKRPPLSTSRSKGTGHKFPSTYQNANSKASAHTNVSRIPSLNLSAHTNVSLSSKGRESHPHLVSHKCLIKLHAAKRPSLSTSRSKGTGNKFPSKSLECQFKSVSSHKCLTNSKSDSSAHTNVSLSSKGRESHPHVVAHKCLTKLHATKWQSLSTSRSKGARNKFHPIISECQFKSVSSHTCLTTSKLNLSAHTNVSLSSKGRESHPHLVSHKCLTKLHAARRPPLSSLYDKKGQETNFHPNI